MEDQVSADPNPLLVALKQYKKDKTITPQSQQTSGAINPFGDLIKKKSQDTNASPNGGDLSNNGSSSSLPFQSPTDESLISQPQSVDMSNGLPHSEPKPTNGLMPVKLVKPTAIEPQSFTQTNGSVRKKNSWENLGDFVPNTVLGGLQKDAGQLLKSAFIDSSPIHKLGAALEGSAQEHQDKANQYQLPNTTSGQVASTAIGFAPDLLELALTPELDVAKIGKLGDVLAKYGGKYAPKLANTLVGKFPLLMGGKGLTSGYSEAKDKGASDYDAMKDALVKSAEEYGKGVLFEGAGKAASKVSDIGKKVLENNGWMADNKIVSSAEKAILNSSAQAAGFSTVPLITNALQGKTTSLDELKNNAIFGGLMGLFHGEEPKSPDKPTAAEGSAQQVLQRSPLIDLHNFMTADMDGIKQVHEMPENATDLQMKASSHAQNAFDATDPEEKQQQIVQSSINGKAASVKAVTDAVLKDKNAVIGSLDDIGLDDQTKSQVIDKINQVHQALDPTERQKSTLGQKIQDIDSQIQQIQPMADNSANPVQKTEAEVGIENLTKLKEDAFKKLKGIVVKQHTDMQSVPEEMPNEQATPDTEISAQSPTDETAKQSQTIKSVDETVGDETVKQNEENTIPKTEKSNQGAEVTSKEPIAEGSEKPEQSNETTKNSSIKPTENESTNEKNGTQEKSGSQEVSQGSEANAKNMADEKGDVEENQPSNEKMAEPSKKIKIDKYKLIQPSKLRNTPHELALGQHSDGMWGIVDKSTGFDISNSKESKWEAIIAYEKNREKLTPKMLEDAKAKLEIPDETTKKPIAKLSEKVVKEVDTSLEPHGITYDQIKDYEQSRSKPTTGLSAGDAKESGRIQEDVRPPDEQVGSSDENTKGEAVREQPEKSASKLKSDELQKNLYEAKKKVSQTLKKQRGQLNSGLNPELLKDLVNLIDAYSKQKIFKFSEIVKDWINTFGKENITDEDADALKSAYAAHVASLDPKERKSYNSLKELDEFMGSEMKTLRGIEPKATIPDYKRKTEPRLPIPKDEETDKNAPQMRKNYTKLSALRSYGIRNLEQLKAFAKDIKDFDAYREVRKFATSKSQSSVILKTATNKILSLVGKGGWQTLREALVESRLRGIKSRWESYAKEAQNYSDDQVKSLFDDGKDGNMYDLVKNLQPLEGESNPAKFAVSLITSGRYDDARKYLSNVFNQAADNVLSLGELSNGKTFDEAVKDGKFVTTDKDGNEVPDDKMNAALDAYKQYIEKPIAQSHESNEGIFSDDLGNLNTYYPLTGENADKNVRVIAKGKPYNEPNNINNRFATGQSDNYSTEIASLSDKLTSAIKTNNKATAIDALKKAGLIIDAPYNGPETEKMQMGNDIYDFVKEKVADGRTIMQDGNIINTKSKYVMMPTWLKSELDPIFNSTDQYDKFNPVGKVMNVLTKVALGGPTEAIAHSYRMLGVITNSMPFMQEWAYKNGVLGKSGGYVTNNPFVKKWTGLFKILNTDISSDGALQTIQEMSKLGIIPEKTWTKTWNREFAELNGAKAMRIKMGKIDVPDIFDFSPVLYGKKSVDLKARVMMYNLVKAMNPEATPEMHVKMQNELGVYTKALQSTMERKIKETGIAPYYTFGSSVYRTALKTVTGASPLPIDYRTSPAKFAQNKAAQLLTNGVIGSAASWMLVYHAQTGRWPWEDESSKLGRVPFPDWAKGDLTKDIFTDSKGDWKDLNMLATNNPIAERGLRVLGAEKAYETHQLGGTAGQSLEAGGTQALNTALSPFTSSPALQAATTLTTGSAPYVTDLRDDRGKPAPQLFKKVKAVDAGMQPVANAYSTLKEVNPLIDAAATQANKKLHIEKSIFGLNSVTNPDSNTEGASALGYILNMAFPRFWLSHGNDAGKATHIEKSQQLLENTIEKEKDAEN